MGPRKIWSLALGVSAMASYSVVDEAASQGQSTIDDNAAPTDEAATQTTCLTTPRRICTTPILCENGDGVPSSGTCPSGKICCLFASPE